MFFKKDDNSQYDPSSRPGDYRLKTEYDFRAYHNDTGQVYNINSGRFREDRNLGWMRFANRAEIDQFIDKLVFLTYYRGSWWNILFTNNYLKVSDSGYYDVLEGKSFTPEHGKEYVKNLIEKGEMAVYFTRDFIRVEDRNHHLSRGQLLALEALEAVTDPQPLKSPSPSQADLEHEPVCTFSQLTLKCHHKKRAYFLDVINSPNTLNDAEKVLQVIAPDKINLQHAGQCVKGHEQCGSVMLSSNQGGNQGKSTTITAGNHNFNAKPMAKARSITGFMDFVKRFMLPELNGLEPHTYTVSNQRCSASTVPSYTGKVMVYPAFKWSGALSLGYDNALKQDKPAGWFINGEIKALIGDKEWAFGSKHTQDEDPASQYFPGLVKAFSAFCDKVGELGRAPAVGATPASKDIVSASITWPKITLNGDIGIEEVQKRWDIDLAGSIGLKLNPLIGAKMQVDIVEVAKKMIGPVHGTFVDKIQKRLEKGVGTDNLNTRMKVELIFSMNGRVDLALKWNKAAKQPWVVPGEKGAAEGKAALTFGLKGDIKVEGLAYYVTFELVAGFAFTGADGSDGVGFYIKGGPVVADGKPGWDGGLHFTGMKVVLSYHVEIANDNKKTDGKEVSSRGGDDREVKTEVKVSNKEETKTEYTLIQPANWPKANPNDQTPTTVDALPL